MKSLGSFIVTHPIPEIKSGDTIIRPAMEVELVVAEYMLNSSFCYQHTFVMGEETILNIHVGYGHMTFVQITMQSPDGDLTVYPKFTSAQSNWKESLVSQINDIAPWAVEKIMDRLN